MKYDVRRFSVTLVFLGYPYNAAWNFLKKKKKTKHCNTRNYNTARNIRHFYHYPLLRPAMTTWKSPCLPWRFGQLTSTPRSFFPSSFITTLFQFKNKLPFQSQACSEGYALFQMNVRWQLLMIYTFDLCSVNPSVFFIVFYFLWM